LTGIATSLMLIPLVSALGGAVLFWIVWKLLRIDVGGDGEETADKASQNLRLAIFLIVSADFMMSLDNVIAVAGSAHGNIVLLIAGLLISMPLLMTTGGVISVLIDKFKWLVFVGAAVISFTATRMIFEDKFISAHLKVPSVLVILISVLVGILVPIGIVLINRRRVRAARLTAPPPGDGPSPTIKT